MILIGYRRYNVEKQVYASVYDDKFLCLEDFARFDTLEMWEARFRFAEKMQKMDFTREEDVLLVAVNIFMAGETLVWDKVNFGV